MNRFSGSQLVKSLTSPSGTSAGSAAGAAPAAGAGVGAGAGRQRRRGRRGRQRWRPPAVSPWHPQRPRRPREQDPCSCCQRRNHQRQRGDRRRKERPLGPLKGLSPPVPLGAPTRGPSHNTSTSLFREAIVSCFGGGFCVRPSDNWHRNAGKWHSLRDKRDCTIANLLTFSECIRTQFRSMVTVAQ
jgi:hypothetical protein